MDVAASSKDEASIKRLEKELAHLLHAKALSSGQSPVSVSPDVLKLNEFRHKAHLSHKDLGWGCDSAFVSREASLSQDVNLIEARFVEGNRYHLRIIFVAPNSPYRNLRHTLEFRYSDNYPFTPPDICFLNSVFHPCIAPRNNEEAYEEPYEGMYRRANPGNIDCKYLKDVYSPAMIMKDFLELIVKILMEPVEAVEFTGHGGVNKLAHEILTNDRDAFFSSEAFSRSNEQIL